MKTNNSSFSGNYIDRLVTEPIIMLLSLTTRPRRRTGKQRTTTSDTLKNALLFAVTTLGTYEAFEAERKAA